MSDKPTSTPGWTATGTAPSSGEKSSGFSSGDRLPAAYVDWFWQNVSSWITWLSDGVLRRSSLSNRSPVLTLADRDGNARSYIDADGYRMGDSIEASYWFSHAPNLGVGNNVSSGAPLYNDFEDSGFNVLIATSEFNTFALDLVCPASPSAAGDGILINTGADVVRNPDDTVAVMEGVVSVDNVSTGACFACWGFFQGSTSDALLDGNFAKAGLRISMGTGDVHTIVSDAGGTTTTTDTGVNVTADTRVRLRVEFHGANTTRGVANSTAPVALFYLDGTLVGTATANLPDGVNGFGPACGVRAYTTGSAANFYVGPFRFACNTELSPTVPG